MTTNQEIKKVINSNGDEKEVVIIEFGNGALNQLRELQKSFSLENEKATIDLAIGVLQKLKDLKKDDEN